MRYTWPVGEKTRRPNLESLRTNDPRHTGAEHSSPFELISELVRDSLG